MRIAIFVHCFFPDHFYGTETYAYKIAKNLQTLGHDVTVVASNFQGEPPRDHEITEFVFDDIRVVIVDKNRHPNERVRDTYYQASMEQPLRNILHKLRPDVVHVTHLINHTAVLIKVLKNLNIPAVATLTDFYGFCFNNKLEDAHGNLCAGPNRSRSNCLACYLKATSDQRHANPFLRWCRTSLLISLIARLIAFAKRYRLPLPPDIRTISIDLTRRPLVLELHYQYYHAVIAPTAFLRKAYLANRLTSPIHTMWFGVDVSRAPKPVRLTGAPLRIGYIGQIAAHKGVDILVEAFIKLGQCNAELVIYGPLDQDHCYSNRLLEKSKGLPIRFESTFTSDKMAQILAGIDLLAIPSRWYENSPLVLLNALASHTPVIVSNVEGLTEFIEEGVNGYSFQRSDAVDLSKVLQRFIKNPRLAADMSRSTSYERSTLDMTEDVLRIYPVRG